MRSHMCPNCGGQTSQDPCPGCGAPLSRYNRHHSRLEDRDRYVPPMTDDEEEENQE